MEQQTQTPIKSTLKSMRVNDKVTFPYSRRKSVRTIASDLKLDTGMIFRSKRDERNEDVLVVTRTDKHKPL